jgi:hypothetical protein
MLVGPVATSIRSFGVVGVQGAVRRCGVTNCFHAGFLYARPMLIRLLARFVDLGVGSPIYQPPRPFPDSESVATSSSSSSSW